MGDITHRITMDTFEGNFRLGQEEVSVNFIGKIQRFPPPTTTHSVSTPSAYIHFESPSPTTAAVYPYSPQSLQSILMSQCDEIIDIEDLLDPRCECENLKCPICHNIFNEPKACGNCLNHFCRSCIDTWRASKPDECPLCKHFVMNKPVPILINLLSKLQFTCPNLINGCTCTVSYEEYLKHARLCPEKMLQCASEGCFDSFKQKDLGDHQEHCPYTFVSCVWCSKAYIRSQMKSHTDQCPDKLEQCSFCQNMFRQVELESHSDQCPQKPVQCCWCQVEVELKDCLEHENTCDLKEVSCLGCKNKMTLIEFYPHQNVCEDYPVVCNRCNESIKRKDFVAHNLEKCLECFSRKHSEEMLVLRAENTNLKDKISDLEMKEENKNRNRNKTLQFSLVLRDPDIFVNGNFAMVRHHKKKNRDRFLLMETEPLGKKMVSWRIRVKSFRSEWFAVGISDETNVYMLHRYQTLGHSSYLASANGTIYSTHNLLWNHQRTDFVIQPSDEVECVFDPSSRTTLTITNLTKNRAVVIEVNPQQLQEKRYYPCICLRFAGDSVQILPSE